MCYFIGSLFSMYSTSICEVRWELNGHIMPSSLRNIRVKNHLNLIVLFQVTVDNVGMSFSETQCRCMLQSSSHCL